MGASLEKEDKVRLKIAGLLQILLGAIGLGRLSLFHVTRASIHACITMLGVFCFCVSFVDLGLVTMEPTMLILLSKFYNPIIYKSIGIIMVIGSAGFGVFDGVKLLFTSERKSTSCCLGFFGWIGMVFVFFIGVIGLSVSAINVELLSQLLLAEETGIQFENISDRDINYISSDITEDGKGTLTFSVSMDVDYLVFVYYVEEDDIIISFEYALLYDLKANEEYTITINYDVDYLGYYETDVKGVAFF